MDETAGIQYYTVCLLGRAECQRVTEKWEVFRWHKKCVFYYKETHSNEIKETKKTHGLKGKKMGCGRQGKLYARFFI